MRELLEQDHYEVLEVKRDASPQDLGRAYRVVRSAYEGDSIALYSVFGDAEADVILERIDEAFQILSDEKARAAYDRLLEEKEAATVESLPADGYAEEAPLVAELSLDEKSSELSGSSMMFEDNENPEAVAEGDSAFDGSTLRRARLRAGVDLEEISEITKVSMTNLKNIEDENFEDLPANVYIRGFVMAYATTIGLDAKAVATDYMTRVEVSRADQGRSRFLGRR